MGWIRSVSRGWEAGFEYLLRGLAITRRQPELYVQLALLYSSPAAAAALLVLYGPHGTRWYAPAVFALPWITVVVAPAVLMLAVHAGHRGEQLSALEATRRGVPWVPRYFWTNVHTTLVFWIPVGLLVWVRDESPLGPLLPGALWAALIGSVVLHQHVRTMLAPYLAIHANHGGREATLASWHLGGQHFWRLLGTFVFGVAPVALPLAVLFGVAELFGPVPVRSALLAASFQLLWVCIQVIRPVLIPALHTLYDDLPAPDRLGLASVSGAGGPGAA